ncbi:MAG: acetate/propionate family kinase [Solirubrobacteraceae bacterium]
MVGAGGEIAAHAQLDAPGGIPDLEGLHAFVAGAGEVAACGHRVVQGGPELRESVRVDDAILARLEDLAELAPLHNHAAVEALREVRRARPELPAVACFDTGFHAAMPEAAARYAIPEEWVTRFGMRRLGFHGLSHAWASRRAAELLERPVAGLRVVSCHLGAGASLAAVVDGRSVDTTMGFTPLDGLVMATRSGSIDPGAMLWLVMHGGLGPDEVEDALMSRSGLAGLSGGSGDMRELLAAAEAGDARAVLAIDVYVHRLCGQIAAMCAALGGLDALVFTGGVGEHASGVRARACARLGFLGVALDDARNAAPGEEDVDLSAPGASVRVLRVAAREELEIARETRRVCGFGAEP